MHRGGSLYNGGCHSRGGLSELGRLPYLRQGQCNWLLGKRRGIQVNRLQLRLLRSSQKFFELARTQ
jgi:hypothetical protein